jgi:regulatory protein
MWLAQREHSRQELGAKLAHWLATRERQARADADTDADADDHAGDAAADAAADVRAPLRRPSAQPALPSPGEIEPLLDALERAGHLSDRRFVESRVHARTARYGNLRIQHELKRLGTAPDAQTLACLKESEAERARAVWAAKFGQPPADATERARQMRFLAGRGFSAETIRSLLAHPADDE